MRISSRMNSAPCSCASSRTPSRKPGSGISISHGHRIHAGDLVPVRLQHGAQRVQAVVLEGEGEVAHHRRDAGVARARPVVPAVVAQPHDPVAAGRQARQPHGGRGRIRAGLHEQDLLRARDQLDQRLGQLGLHRPRQRQREPLLDLPDRRGVHHRMAVAEHDRAEAQDPVHVAVAVHVPDVRALPARPERRIDAGNERRRCPGLGRPLGHRAQRPRIFLLGTLQPLVCHHTSPAPVLCTNVAASSRNPGGHECRATDVRVIVPS